MFVRPRAISEEDKGALRSAGVIVVETDDPANIRLVQAGHDLPTSALLAAAGAAISMSSTSEQAFGRLMAAALKAQFGK